MRALFLLLVSKPLWCRGTGPCPKEQYVASDGTSSEKRTVKFENGMDAELDLWWVDFRGTEVAQGQIMPLSEAARETFVGHVFRVRWKTVLVHEVKVSAHLGTTKAKAIRLNKCGDVSENKRDTSRDAEFAALMDDKRPCGVETASAAWSCVRFLTISDLERRSKVEYGLQPNETRPSRHYQTVDSTYVSQIATIPKVTPPRSPGFALMNFTEPLTQLLGDWYAQRRQDSIRKHDVIPGGYTNNDVVSIDKIDLDRFPHIQNAIIREMRQILEWWTDLKLKHTSTFGVRIYRRDSCLINHVDRMDTHLASAVIHIHQHGVDEGWPLELYLPDYQVAEVYTQPRQLILYEGAWLRHGRPMRFKGDEFANVFSHFAPPDWTGPRSAAAPGLAPKYYGIPDDRLTTLADDPGVLASDFFERKKKTTNNMEQQQQQQKIRKPPEAEAGSSGSSSSSSTTTTTTGGEEL